MPNTRQRDVSQLVSLRIEIGSTPELVIFEALDLYLDSGVNYPVIPKGVLRRLGVKSHSTREFRLPNGSLIKRRLGPVYFRLGGKLGVSDAIFGEDDEVPLLGVFALQSMGLSFDPIKRQLISLQMPFGGFLA